MPRYYPQDHPCFRCPPHDDGRQQHLVDGECAPVAQVCEPDPDTGREQHLVNGECVPVPVPPEVTFWDGIDASGIPQVSDEDLPYPQLQFNSPDHELVRDLAAHTVTREKLIISRGSSFYLWDNLRWFIRKEALESLREFTDFENMEVSPGAPPFYGFPGLYKLYNPGRHDHDDWEQKRWARPDPLRWMTGKVWVYTPAVHRNVNNAIEDANSRLAVTHDLGADFGSMYGTRAQSQGGSQAEWTYRYDLEETIYGTPRGYLPYGAFASFKFGLEGPRKRLSYLEGFGTVLDEDFNITFDGHALHHRRGGQGTKFNFLKHLTAGYLHNADPADDNSDSRRDVFSFLFFPRNQNTWKFGEQSRDYIDLSHKAQMPFFGEEIENVAFTSKLSADVKIISNSISSRFVNYDGEERSMPSAYRIFRQKINYDPDPDCVNADYNNMVQKFTSRNISQHFKEIHKTYKHAFAMVAEIKFQTLQVNNIANLFRDYGMDKYLLDLWDRKSEVDFQLPPVDSTHQSYVWDLGSGILFPGIRYRLPRPPFETRTEFSPDFKGAHQFTEYLEQNALFRDARGHMHRDRNYWTSDGAESFISNEKINYSRALPVATLKNFFEFFDMDGVMESFDETLFPLGVFPTDGSLDETSDWSLAVGKLNKEFLKAKLNSLVWESYSDVPTNDQSGDFTARKKYLRTFEGMINGELAYAEPIAYVVRKYDITEGLPGIYKQSFYFADSSDVSEVDFIDTQIKYNRRYRYYINAINFVIGNKYTYRALSESHEESLMPTGEGSTYLDELLLDRFTAAQRASGFSEHARESYLESDMAQGAADTLGFTARTIPHMVIMEVPYFRKDVITLDRPPLPPQVDLVPYKDIKNKVLINLLPSGGTRFETPILIYEEDIVVATQMKRNEGTEDLPRTNPRYGKVEFAGDSMPTSYEILYLQNPRNPPSGYSSFSPAAGGRIRSINSASGTGNVHYDFDIAPNVKYYMCFRARDIAGRSNPSEVYHVELVSYADGMYLVVEEYRFPDPPTILRRSINRSIQILPRLNQLNTNPSAPVQIGAPQKSIWDKQYRLRVKSKKTGRTVDLDFVFKTDGTTVQAQQPAGGEPEPHQIEPCGKDLPAGADALGTPNVPDVLPGSPSEPGPCSAEADYIMNNIDPISPSWELIGPHPPLFELPANCIIWMGGQDYRSQNTFQCGCPPDFQHIGRWRATIPFYDEQSAQYFDLLQGCYSGNLLDPGKVLFVRPWNTGNGFLYSISQTCAQGLEVCEDGCFEPCPPGTSRAADCGCESVCPPTQIWGPPGSEDPRCYCPDVDGQPQDFDLFLQECVPSEEQVVVPDDDSADPDWVAEDPENAVIIESPGEEEGAQAAEAVEAIGDAVADADEAGGQPEVVGGGYIDALTAIANAAGEGGVVATGGAVGGVFVMGAGGDDDGDEPEAVFAGGAGQPSNAVAGDGDDDNRVDGMDTGVGDDYD